jgi:hypothetical protein
MQPALLFPRAAATLLAVLRSLPRRAGDDNVKRNLLRTPHLQPQPRPVILRQGVPLLIRKQPSNYSHRLIDIVRALTTRKRSQLIQNIIRILPHQRRRTRTIRHRPMTSLARRNPAFAISKRDQARCDRCMARIRRRLRKRAIILKVRKHRKLGIISHDIRQILCRKRVRNRTHRSRCALAAAKILQLFPHRQLVHTRKVRSRLFLAESLGPVTMFAALRQQRPAESISGRSCGDRLRSPLHVRRNVIRSGGEHPA